MRKGPIGWIASVWRFVFDVGMRWYHGRVGDLAASVTFWLLISLPASVLALLAMLGPLNQVISRVFSAQLDEAQLEEEVLSLIGRVFSDESGVIHRTVESLFNQSNSGLFVISLGLALWSISRGFAGLIRALEDIYDIEERRTWYHTRFVAVVLGVGSMLVPIPLILLDQVVWSRLPASGVVLGLRTLVAVLVLILWASVLYHFGPAKRYRWSFDLPGAVVAAVGWWLLTLGFTWWVERSSTVASAVGTSILALTWVWMAAQVLLVGGAVNYLFGERLGVRRGRRPWTLPEMVRNGTDEIKKIVAPERADGHRADGHRAVVGVPTDEPAPTGSLPVAEPPTDRLNGSVAEPAPTAQLPLVNGVGSSRNDKPRRRRSRRDAIRRDADRRDADLNDVNLRDADLRGVVRPEERDRTGDAAE